VPDAVPRPAASVLLLRDDPLEVLMVTRPAGGAFASAVAFPGGSVDAGDGDPADGTDAAARAAAVRETAEETGILDDPAALVPFARWVTPASAPRRFDTWFFAALAPDGAEPVVDGVELVAAEWIAPTEALRRRDAGVWQVVPPTAFQLLRIAQHARAAEVLAAAREVPVTVIEPEVVATPDGGRAVRIPSGTGYPVTDVAVD
jgi:8-oxo-dGTP pyrophosphatase MutT (NUDIX family)